MKVQFEIVFKDRTKTVATIKGREDVARDLTVGDVVERVQETEAFLEKLTGLRVHINQIS